MTSPRYRKTPPEFADSFGHRAFARKRYRLLEQEIIFWNVTGSVNKIWTGENGLNQKIQEILAHNKLQLQPPRSLTTSKFPPYALRCYMIGPDKDHASPHVVILCDSDHLRKNAREVVLAHGILSNQGWGRAFVSLPARVKEVMKEDYNVGPVQPSSEEETEDEMERFHIFCQDTEFPTNSMGISIVLRHPNLPSRTATLGGLLQINDETYGITVAHVFTDKPCHDMPYPVELEMSEELPSEEEIGGLTLVPSDQMTGTLQYLPSNNWRCLDYALFKINSHHPWGPNFAVSVNSHDSWDFYTPSRIAFKMPAVVVPANEPDIIIPCGHRLLTGNVIESDSVLSTGDPDAAIRVWTVSMSPAEDGSCGSWVLDKQDKQLLGMLIAASPDLSEAYILPAEDIIDDIMWRDWGMDIKLLDEPATQLLKSIQNRDFELMSSAILGLRNMFMTFRGDGYTRLYKAASMGDLSSVKQYIEQGDDLEAGRSSLSVTPVFESLRLREFEIAQRLINFRFDVNRGSELEESTPLYIAIKNGHADVVEALINAGAQKEIVHRVYKAYSLEEAHKHAPESLVRSLETLLLAQGDALDVRSFLTTQASVEVEREYPNSQIRSAIQKAEDEERTENTDEEDSETS